MVTGAGAAICCDVDTGCITVSLTLVTGLADADDVTVVIAGAVELAGQTVFGVSRT